MSNTTTIAEALRKEIDYAADGAWDGITDTAEYQRVAPQVVTAVARWLETGVNVAVEQANSLGYKEEAVGILRESGLIDPEPEPEPEPVAEEAPTTLDAILDAVNAVKAQVETDLSELVRRVGALERAAADNGIRLG